MYLTLAQADRFFNLINALTVFAETEFDVGSELFAPNGEMDKTTQFDLLEAVAETPEVIDSFVELNPAGLSADELEEVASWKDALTGMFAIRTDDAGNAIFMSDKCAFNVCGITHEISDNLGIGLNFAHATLFPFQGKIVYGVSLMQMPVGAGGGMVAMIEDEIAGYRDNGKIYATADDLVRESPRIKEDAVKREAQEVKHNEELEKSVNDEVKGAHKGALAGLNEESRQRAIDENLDFKGTYYDILMENMHEAAVAEEDCSSLASLLEHMDDTQLSYFAEDIGADVPPKAGLEDTVSAVAAKIDADPNSIESALAFKDSFVIKAVKDHIEGNGPGWISQDTPKEKRPPRLGVLLRCQPFIFLVEEMGQGADVPVLGFSPFMHPAIEEALAKSNLDKVLSAALEFEEQCDFARLAVQLRGIVSLQDLCMEWIIAHGNRDTLQEIVLMQEPNQEFFDASFRELVKGLIEAILSSPYTGEDYEILETDDGEQYLVAWQLREAIESDKELVRFYELAKSKADIAPLTEEMIEAGDISEYKMKLPETIALRDFLDHHVPDDENDYTFADCVIEDLLTLSEEGARPNDYIEYLSDLELALNEAQLRKMLDLLMGMINALPIWENAGWSPNDIREFEMEKLKYEKQASRKVGRNDPCPCGSGKKYKKCCGR